MSLFRLLIVGTASLALSGCITYSSEYANDGYYSSPDDRYGDYGDNYYGSPDTYYGDYGYGGDGYYGNPGNYGQYSYGSGGYSSISFIFNFGPSYSRYRYYPSYYGYYQCSPWSAYCDGGYNSGYGWGYPPHYSYYPRHHKPKPKPPGDDYHDYPKHRPNVQPGFAPNYPIVDRPDGPRQRQPVYRPGVTAPVQHNVPTQPIANGNTQSTLPYVRQQRQRPVSMPINQGNEYGRYVEREADPRQAPNRPQRQQSRAVQIQQTQADAGYARFPNSPRDMPTQQDRAPQYQPRNSRQQNSNGTMMAQQMPQQGAEPKQRAERRERSEPKQREPKAERERDGDKP